MHLFPPLCLAMSRLKVAWNQPWQLTKATNQLSPAPISHLLNIYQQKTGMVGSRITKKNKTLPS